MWGGGKSGKFGREVGVDFAVLHEGGEERRYCRSEDELAKLSQVFCLGRGKQTRGVFDECFGREVFRFPSLVS